MYPDRDIRIKKLVEKINWSKGHIPENLDEAKRTQDEWAEAEQELFELIGSEEFKRLTGRAYESEQNNK